VDVIRSTAASIFGSDTRLAISMNSDRKGSVILKLKMSVVTLPSPPPLPNVVSSEPSVS